MKMFSSYLTTTCTSCTNTNTAISKYPAAVVLLFLATFIEVGCLSLLFLSLLLSPAAVESFVLHPPPLRRGVVIVGDDAIIRHRHHVVVHQHQKIAFGNRIIPATPKQRYSSSSFGAAAPSAFDETKTKNEEKEVYYQLSIEYCTGCRWGLRAFWMAQELLTTFSANDSLQSITLIPSRPSVSDTEGGRYRIKLYSVSKDGSTDDASDGNTNDNNNNMMVLLWDRQVMGRFPELKELKQLVRNQILPDMYLGHSDDNTNKDPPKQVNHDGKEPFIEKFVKSTGYKVKDEETEVITVPTIQSAISPHISMRYCTGCRWLLRSAYYCQEITTTFSDEINSISLIPSRPPMKGGVFITNLDDDNNNTIWDRFIENRFPETKEFKQRIRDLLNPTKDLGHSDNNYNSNRQREKQPDTIVTTTTLIAGTTTIIDDDDEEEETEEARKYFGVF